MIIKEDCIFSDWVLGVGDGTIGEITDDNIKVQIPDDLLINSSGDHIASIVDCIYPSILHNIHDLSFFEHRAILTPKNVIIDEINDYVLSQTPNEEKTYLSCDSPYADNQMIDRPDDVQTLEFLNTVNSPGLLNHKLKLKVGIPVMLLRNLHITTGMCNGTRLIITRMRRYVLEEKVISGSNIWEKVYIPRLSLTPSYPKIPFKFQRKQFPISVYFAMTINKS